MPGTCGAAGPRHRGSWRSSLRSPRLSSQADVLHELRRAAGGRQCGFERNGHIVDVLLALKGEDSFCKTATSGREDVLGSVEVAVVFRPALAACPSAHSKTCDTFRPRAAGAARTGLG